MTMLDTIRLMTGRVNTAESGRACEVGDGFGLCGIEISGASRFSFGRRIGEYVGSGYSDRAFLGLVYMIS
jgi:hypothetical protein